MARVLSFYVGTDEVFWAAIGDEGKPLSVTLGRTGQSDLVVPDFVSGRARSTVSRTHARVFCQEGTFRIEDLNSSNLTMLDGRIVLAPTVMQFPCIVQLGSVRVTIKQENLEQWKERSAAPPGVKAGRKSDVKTTAPQPDSLYRDEFWNQVRGELRWATAIHDILNLVSQGKRADDVEHLLKEVLCKHLGATDVHTFLGLPVEQTRSHLERQGLDTATVDAVHLHMNQIEFEKPLVRVPLKGKCGYVWGVRSIDFTDPTGSIVIAYSNGPECETMAGDRADAIVAESTWIARPYIAALRELEEQRAAQIESVPHEPSATARVVCEEVNLWGVSEGFQKCVYQAELGATRYLNRPDSGQKLPVIYFQGESGTGKSALARLVHRLSDHKGHAFHELNCAAIPITLAESELFGYERGAHDKAFTSKQGYFEIANGGTLFLDEIGKTTKEFQSKLLKVLDTGSFTPLGSTRPKSTNCYVILADSEDPLKMCDEDRLLKELWYRVGAFNIALPPLRERPEDIELLAKQRVRALNKESTDEDQKDLIEEALGLLKGYSWPGNVRELMQCVEVAYSMSPSGDRHIRPNHLPDNFLRNFGVGAENSPTGDLKIDPNRSLADHVSALERQYLAYMVGACEGNLSELTRRSGKAYQTILNKLKELRAWLDGPESKSKLEEVERLRQAAGEYWGVITK